MFQFNKINLWRKFIFTYCIIIVVPICFIGYFLTNRLQTLSLQSSIKLSDITVQQLSENLLNKLSMYSDMIRALTNDWKLNTYINSSYDGNYEAYSDYITYIDPLMSRLGYMDSHAIIRVYNNNATIGLSRIVNNSIEDLKRDGWIDLSKRYGNSLNWVGAGKKVVIDGEEYLGCCRIFTGNADYEKISHVLAVFFKEEELFKLISKEREGGKTIFVYDNNGSIITSTERDRIGNTLNELDFGEGPQIVKRKSGSLLKYKDKDYLFIGMPIYKEKLSINDWGIIFLIPANTIISGVRNIFATSLVICLLCILFSLIVTLFLSHNITGRISKLVKRIKDVKAGKFKMQMDVSGTDEISMLEVDFYEMVEEIDRLINEVYSANLKIKDAEIANQKILMKQKEAVVLALQRQINPHYLFNTLESIRMKLLLKGDRITSEVIRMFGETFRECFVNDSDIHTLYDELSFIENYFNVQKYRYGEKLNLVKNIPGYLLEYKIPKLLIQPIAENSIYHGIEMKSGGGTVLISAIEKEDALFITVSDDGVGMDQIEYERLIEGVFGEAVAGSETGRTRVALRNVQSRIKLIYGDDYGIKIHSIKGVGTEVIVKLPVPDRNAG